jgi:response regulator RpfG family c-di-GMP phosphodiesterase
MQESDATVDVEPAAELIAVLAVDDEPSVLSALTRLLLPRGIRVLTATSGPAALLMLEEHAASIGVLMSDYAMPGMNGAELMHAVRLRWPDIVRVLLTGNADLAAAARAVNEGQLSQLYTKPWKADERRQAVTQAREQYRVVVENRGLRALADEQAVRLEELNQHLEGLVAERTSELAQANLGLQRGLLETVRLLLFSLEHRLPLRAARCKEVARLAGRLAERAGMDADAARRVQVAALVHDVGLIGLPDAILRRPPAELSMNARAVYQGHTALGERMLSAVDELTDMANWIRHHHERWDGRGYPDQLVGDAIPLPSRIIALADGYLEALMFEAGTALRWRTAQKMNQAFDPRLLQVLDDELVGTVMPAREKPQSVSGGVSGRSPRRQPGAGVEEVQTTAVAVARLRSGMVIFGEVYSTSGAVLVRSGERLTEERLQRLRQLGDEGLIETTEVEVTVGTLVTESAPPLV